MKAKIILTITVIFSMLLTGCYDRIEMDDRNYIITLGVDKYEYNSDFEQENPNLEKQYNITLGKATPTGKAENTGDESEKKDTGVEVISGTTLTQALRTSDKYNSKSAYYGQLKTVIFGEELMKDSELFKNAVEELKNDNEVNDSVLVLGCKGDAKSVMEAVLEGNTSAGLYIWDFYKSSGREISSKMVNIQRFTKDTEEYGGTMLPLIYEENGNVVIDGSIAVNNYSLGGFLEDDVQKGANWIKGNGRKTITEILSQDKYLGIKILKNKSKIDFHETDKGIECEITIDIDGSIEDKSNTVEDIFAVEEKLKQEIENQVNMALSAQDLYGTDFMQLSRQLMQKNYKLYNYYNGEINSFKTSINVSIKK